SSDPCKRPAAIRHRDGHDNFVGSGSVIDSNLHAIEVAADESGVFVPQRHIEGDTHPASLLRRWDEGGAFADHSSYWRTKFGMENRRAVLDLTVFAHGRRLAIAPDAGRR